MDRLFGVARAARAVLGMAGNRRAAGAVGLVLGLVGGVWLALGRPDVYGLPDGNVLAPAPRIDGNAGGVLDQRAREQRGAGAFRAAGFVHDVNDAGGGVVLDRYAVRGGVGDGLGGVAAAVWGAAGGVGGGELRGVAG